MDGSDIFLLLCWMKTMARPVYVFRMGDGRKKMIFMRSALLPGAGIWKVCGNTARPEKEKDSGQKDIENKKNPKLNNMSTNSVSFHRVIKADPQKLYRA